MRELSPKQWKILEFIGAFVDEHDYPPTIRQIQEACEISSTSVVDYNLRALEKLGYIHRVRDVSRGIELVDKRPRVVAIPIIGTIAAGQPIPVPSADTWQQYDSETVHVPPDKVGKREHVYALRVKGESMIDALVNDGDIVVMQKAETAQDGEMVAAWLKDEQEATLKRFYHEGDRVRLQPANRTMAPIYTDAAKIQVRSHSGRVLPHDTDVLSRANHQLRKVRGRDIAMVFQDPATGLNPVLSVGQQVEEIITHHVDVPRREAKQRTVQVLAQMGLPDPEQVASRYPFQLSGGMSQRVMIAIATALNPKVLVLDEPTSALGVTVQAAILHGLRRLQHTYGTSILLLTHDLGLVEQLNEDVALIHTCSVVSDADAATLL